MFKIKQFFLVVSLVFLTSPIYNALASENDAPAAQAVAVPGQQGRQLQPKTVEIDLNHDGKPDLVLHFNTQATGIKCGDASASLTGKTFGGLAIEGSDSIRTVGCK